MKIKDVEIKVGITKANIRYYEKEGLISPGRNDEKICAAAPDSASLH